MLLFKWGAPGPDKGPHRRLLESRSCRTLSRSLIATRKSLFADLHEGIKTGGDEFDPLARRHGPSAQATEAAGSDGSDIDGRILGKASGHDGKNLFGEQARISKAIDPSLAHPFDGGRSRLQ